MDCRPPPTDVYQPPRDAQGSIMWRVDSNWVPQSWDNVPTLDSVAAMYSEVEKSRRTHEKGEKPFECGMCTKKYARRTDAHIHVLEKHLGFFRFMCRTCNFKTSRHYHLSRHINKTLHRPWNSIQAHRVENPWTNRTLQADSPSTPNGMTETSALSISLKSEPGLTTTIPNFPNRDSL